MSKKLTRQERAQIAMQYHSFQPIKQIQTWWKNKNGKNAVLKKKTIYRFYNNLTKNGSVENIKRQPKISMVRDAENIATVKDIVVRNPDKSV